MKSRFYFLFFFVLASYVEGQDIRLKTLSTKEGLSQNSVNQVFQDSRGYLWFATQDGLNRYNGYEFKIYRPDPDDSLSIPDNFVIQILEDSLRRLWVSTRSGICVFDPVSEKFYRLFSGLGHPQKSFLRAHNGYFYFINSNLDSVCMLSRVKADLEPTDYSSEFAVELVTEFKCPKFESYIFHGDDLWLTGPADTWNFTRNTFYRNGGTHVYAGAQAWEYVKIDTSKYLLSNQTSVAVFDASDGSLSAARGEFAPSCFQVIGTDIWMGGRGGIFRFSNVTEQPIIVSTSPDLSDRFVHDIFLDRSGLLWLGTANTGAFSYSTSWDNFGYLGLQGEIVWGAGNVSGGIALATNSGLILEGTRYLDGKRILSVFQDRQGVVWAGDSKGGIWKKERSSPVFMHGGIELTNPAPITAMTHDHSGSLWIGSHTGLLKIGTDGQVDRYESSPKLWIYTLGIYCDSRNAMWIGSNYGLFYIDAEGVTHDIPYKRGDPQSPNFNFVSSIVEDRQGRIWAGTYGGGISRLNSDSTFTHFTESQGLSNNVVHDIEVDDKGKFWIVSNGGVSRFDPDLGEFINFSESDGLLSQNFSLGGGVKVLDGRIGFGSVDGLLVFHPDSIELKMAPPPLKWEGLYINYEPVTSVDFETLTNVTLTSEDKVFSVEFAALNYSNPEDVSYSYRLEGFGQNWVPVKGVDRRVTYSTLPYDTYRLSVRACSRNSRFEPVIRTLRITVEPPLWLTWWFISLSVFFVLISLTGIVFYLSRINLKRRVRELEMKAKIQGERERISKDLHDSVGSHFTFIISRLDFMYLSWAKENEVSKRENLKGITEFARSGMRLLRETIWAMSNASVPVENFRSRILDYLSLTCKGMNIQYRLEFENTVDEIDSGIALNLFRIIQEATNNAIKHSAGTEVVVVIRFLDGLSVQVSDNGRGFDYIQDLRSDGHYGLSNMSARAKEIGAHFEVVSGATGTLISVTRNNPN